MTRFTTTRCSGLIIEVPDELTDVRIAHGELQWEVGIIFNSITLPDTGQWTLLGLSKELTEEQCEGIVGDHNRLFEYPDYENHDLCLCGSSTQSFNSLLTSLKLSKDKCYAVVLKM